MFGSIIFLKKMTPGCDIPKVLITHHYMHIYAGRLQYDYLNDNVCLSFIQYAYSNKIMLCTTALHMQKELVQRILLHMIFVVLSG